VELLREMLIDNKLLKYDYPSWLLYIKRKNILPSSLRSIFSPATPYKLFFHYQRSLFVWRDF
jgi:hypothetical protein